MLNLLLRWHSNVQRKTSLDSARAKSYGNIGEVFQWWKVDEAAVDFNQLLLKFVCFILNLRWNDEI